MALVIEGSLSLLRNNYNTWGVGRQKRGDGLRVQELKSLKLKVEDVEGRERAAVWAEDEGGEKRFNTEGTEEEHRGHGEEPKEEERPASEGGPE